MNHTTGVPPKDACETYKQGDANFDTLLEMPNCKGVVRMLEIFNKSFGRKEVAPICVIKIAGAKRGGPGLYMRIKVAPTSAPSKRESSDEEPKEVRHELQDDRKHSRKQQQ